MSGRRGSRTLWWLSGAIIDANQPSCYLLVLQMMLWKAKQGMIGRKAPPRRSSTCEKGEVCYIGSTREKHQVTLLGSKKWGVHHGEWWLSQKTGLRTLWSFSPLPCFKLMSCYCRFYCICCERYFHRFKGYRRVCLGSALNFVGHLLKNWHLQN